MTDDVLFKSHNEALIFAFRFATEQYAISPTAKLMKSGVVGNGRGLVSLDGAAQAGLILANVRRLTPIQQACIVCRYSERFTACKCGNSCCSGTFILEEYRKAILFLDDVVALPALTGITLRQMRHAIIRNYFEPKKAAERLSIGQAADRLKVARRTAYDMKTKIETVLIDHDKTARTKIDEYLGSMCGYSAA
ncbi:hypothetical protein [Noviherbaspirillum saxi]|uniref:Uncharacterized protein n=1 Tax=Noviherbaspirillum saxi TaxID=2320863 RepID=A0A3A3GDP6_9BURK|nr:hypothetical protein [Noviherbaspirillum saxi]RJF99029.1 hypothetical protein D3871_11290 [Noviherbaspirillum saxi]